MIFVHTVIASFGHNAFKKAVVLQCVTFIDCFFFRNLASFKALLPDSITYNVMNFSLSGYSFNGL